MLYFVVCGKERPLFRTRKNPLANIDSKGVCLVGWLVRMEFLLQFYECEHSVRVVVVREPHLFVVRKYTPVSLEIVDGRVLKFLRGLANRP